MTPAPSTTTSILPTVSTAQPLTTGQTGASCGCGGAAELGLSSQWRLSRVSHGHLVIKQPSKHYIHGLSHSEVEAPIYRAPWLPAPEPPSPPTVCALAPCVDAVLPQQHDHTREQAHCLLFECRLRDRLLTAELVLQHLELFQK